jgi:hypothetical protein
MAKLNRRRNGTMDFADPASAKKTERESLGTQLGLGKWRELSTRAANCVAACCVDVSSDERRVSSQGKAQAGFATLVATFGNQPSSRGHTPSPRWSVERPRVLTARDGDSTGKFCHRGLDGGLSRAASNELMEKLQRRRNGEASTPVAAGAKKVVGQTLDNDLMSKLSRMRTRAEGSENAESGAIAEKFAKLQTPSKASASDVSDELAAKLQKKRVMSDISNSPQS